MNLTNIRNSFISIYGKAKSAYRDALNYFDEQHVLYNIRHRHGVKPSASNAGEFFVVCLVKNGEEYIREFVDYYINLSAKHIFIIDNNSTDNTIDIAKSHDKVSVYSTKLKFASYESKIRRYFLKHYFKHSWVLCVDVDEHFDFPGRNEISMYEFIGYLNRYKYTAVTACMLDMYSVETQANTSLPGFSDMYPFVSIDTIDKASYPNTWLTRGNIVPDNVGIYMNGIRKRALKSNHEFLLTKHPLMYISKEIIPFTHPHYCAFAKIADVVCVLLHYKFTAGFLTRAKQISLDPKTHPIWAQENLAYVKYFAENKYWSNESNSYRYTSATDLATKKLLYISDLYFAYLKENGGGAKSARGKVPAIC